MRRLNGHVTSDYQYILSYNTVMGFQIDYMWEDLRKEFVQMDPYGTGYVAPDEFKDVLQELCVHLSEYELNMLTSKFSIGSDGRWEK